MRFPQSRSWGAGADRAVHQHQMPLLPPHHRGAARGDARGDARAVQPHLAGRDAPEVDWDNVDWDYATDVDPCIASGDSDCAVRRLLPEKPGAT